MNKGCSSEINFNEYVPGTGHWVPLGQYGPTCGSNGAGYHRGTYNDWQAGSYCCMGNMCNQNITVWAGAEQSRGRLPSLLTLAGVAALHAILYTL